MPSFRVHVASLETGAESSIILTSADQATAAADANALGLMVSSVTEVTMDPPAAAHTPLIDLTNLISDALDDPRTYKRVRKLITRGVSEGVLVGTVLAAIMLALLGSCIFLPLLTNRH